MNINFEVKPKQVAKNIFEFGNIHSFYDANNVYFTKNGEAFLPISGEFHFSRYNANDWKRELLKMKANGLNAVATYIFWVHHEEKQGVFNFSGNKDINKFLSICKEIDMPCVLRIGPWAHGECVRGGFPKHIQKMMRKRGDYPKYLQAVEVFWTKLYEQVKDYCDGQTVIGIQLENEYTGSIKHIHTLRNLAIKIGFKTPFFTMTAWPTNAPDTQILPLFGGYPEAPWTFHKKQLSPNGRFAICKGRSEVEIGEDLIKGKREKVAFDDFPYAGCEVGTGNQVTQHRRPNISEKDGYGVAFAKFASGMNWLGYYMYHGGRNPIGGLYQESRRTFYPNNYPIIDYDFQAPLSKDGELRESGKLLRLLHYFISTWDKDIAKKQAFFADSDLDYSKGDYPYCSVRCDENLSGYLFVSNYERSRKSHDINGVHFVVKNYNDTIKLPSLNIKKDVMFYLPFNFKIGDTNINYVLAQPIAKVDNTYYFKQCEGVEPSICINGKVQDFISEIKVESITLKMLSDNIAKSFYIANDKVQYFDGVLFEDNNKSYIEQVENAKLGIELKEISKVKLPYNHYLYSYGKRKYYKLIFDKNQFDKYDDIIVELEFFGLNLQVFANEKLVDDYFNTTGKYNLHLRNVINCEPKCKEIIIKTVAPTKYGVGNVYNEINLMPQQNDLKMTETKTMKIKQINEEK